MGMGGLVARVARMEEAERGRAEGGAMAVPLWRNGGEEAFRPMRG